MLLGMVAFSVLTANFTSSLNYEIEEDLNLFGKTVSGVYWSFGTWFAEQHRQSVSQNVFWDACLEKSQWSVWRIESILFLRPRLQVAVLNGSLARQVAVSEGAKYKGRQRGTDIVNHMWVQKKKKRRKIAPQSHSYLCIQNEWRWIESEKIKSKNKTLPFAPNFD